MSRNATDCLNEIQRALAHVRAEEMEAAGCLLADALCNGRGVYICGNGGSASTASHMAVDLGKNVRLRSKPRMRVVSLTDNVPWLTALANDEGYADCFAQQLRNYLHPGDLVIGISVSGDSENVVRTFELARECRVKRLALVGRGGGRLARLATALVRVDSYDYGVVETVHLAVAHVLVRMLSDEGAFTPRIEQEREMRHSEVYAAGPRRPQAVPLATLEAAPGERTE